MFSRNPPYAMRATLISTDILKRRSMHSDAAMQFLKMITEVSTDCTHCDQLSQWVGQFAHYAARHLLQVITVLSTLYLDAGTQLFRGLGLWWETRNITQQMTLVYFTDIDGRPEILPNRWHWCILLTLMGDQKYHPTDCIGVFYWHWINWLIQDGRSSVMQQPFMKPYKQLKMKNEYLVSRWAELSRFEQVRNRESYFGLKGWRKRKSAYAL